MLAGESKDRSLHRGPAVSWGLPVGSGGVAGEAEAGKRWAACRADREPKGGEKLSGLSQAGAGLGVGGMGPGAKNR